MQQKATNVVRQHIDRYRRKKLHKPNLKRHLVFLSWFRFQINDPIISVSGATQYKAKETLLTFQLMNQMSVADYYHALWLSKLSWLQKPLRQM